MQKKQPNYIYTCAIYRAAEVTIRTQTRIHKLYQGYTKIYKKYPKNSIQQPLQDLPIPDEMFHIIDILVNIK